MKPWVLLTLAAGSSHFLFFLQHCVAGRLNEDRIAKLDLIGFDWGREVSEEARYKNNNKSKNEEFWQQMYQRLVQFQEQEGHCNVPQSKNVDRSLASWVSDQRRRRNKHEMRPDRIELLDAIGFRWNLGQDRLDELWMRRYSELKRILDGDEEQKVTLAVRVWVENQREEYAKGRLDANREALLREIDFVFDTDQPAEQMWAHHEEKTSRRKTSRGVAGEEEWMENYNELREFVATTGTAYLSLRVHRSNQKLYRWMHYQRKLYTNGSLLPHRKNLLDEIDWGLDA
jgi:hypothetical protein